MTTPINVVLIGASAKPYAWSQRSHLPALKALQKDSVVRRYAIYSTVSSSAETAEAAKVVFGPTSNKAHANLADACSDEQVDIAVVAVNVQIHTEPCMVAADHGKTILCEWPLGRSLADTNAIAEYARAKGVRGFVMTQAVTQPAFRHIKQVLLPQLGNVYSVTVVSHTPVWSSAVYLPYLCDRTTGGSMVTIPMGHTIAGLRFMFGELTRVSAFGNVSRKSKPIMGAPAGTPNMECTSFDTVVVNGRFASGALLSYAMRGDSLKTEGLVIEIQCDQGHIKIVGESAFTEMTKLKIFLASPNGEYAEVSFPQFIEETGGIELDESAECVARFYYHLSRHLSGDTNAITCTFEDGVKNYAVVDAIVRSADADGEVIALN